FAALRSGASGFVLKDTLPEQLLDAIRVTAGGEALLTPRITRRLIAEFARHPVAVAPEPGPVAGITDREREVLALVAAGQSNAEIAAGLHLSVATVKTHVSRLLARLGLRDRAQLVVIAYESGLIRPGERAPGQAGERAPGQAGTR
ncbi:MAG: DNA-binding response regulator, partial [Streptosporangiaceae bacterium]